jgi:hypothetical protein
MATCRSAWVVYSEWVFWDGLIGRVVICCSLLVNFWRSGVLWHCFWFYADVWFSCFWHCGAVSSYVIQNELNYINIYVSTWKGEIIRNIPFHPIKHTSDHRQQQHTLRQHPRPHKGKSAKHAPPSLLHFNHKDPLYIKRQFLEKIKMIIILHKLF